jgi:RNA recognition motif-containing protein
MSIVVHNIAPETTEVQLREFFSYCGDISAVAFHPPNPTTGDITATVLFVHGESVDIAELLSGAAINGFIIGVQRGTQTSPIQEPEKRFSAVGAVEGLSASGLLRGGKEIISSIQDKALALDQKYGVRKRVVEGAKAVGRTAVGAANYVMGRTDKGDVQVQFWNWKANQPQWGPDPRLDAQRREGAGAASAPAL